MQSFWAGVSNNSDGDGSNSEGPGQGNSSASLITSADTTVTSEDKSSSEKMEGKGKKVKGEKGRTNKDTIVRKQSILKKGAFEALPGETWPQYYARYKAFYRSHYIVSDTLSIFGALTSIANFAQSYSMTVATIVGEKGFAQLGKNAVTIFGEGKYTFVKGYGKMLGYNQVSAGLKAASSATTVVTVGATGYGIGLQLNAFISYQQTKSGN